MPSKKRAHPPSLADRLLAATGEGAITAAEQAAAAEASFSPVPGAVLVPIERIAPSPDNPRKSFEGLDELADSIAERGLLQPLLVRRDGQRPGHYVTVAGSRRLRAAQLVRERGDPAGAGRVAALPCTVEEATDREAFADALTENLARQDLSRAEVMAAVVRLHEEEAWSAREIARRTGRSFSDVAELLRVARDDEVAAMVRAQVLTPTAAGQLQRLPRDLKAAALDGARKGRLRTVQDIRRLRGGARGAGTSPDVADGRDQAGAPRAAQRDAPDPAVTIRALTRTVEAIRRLDAPLSDADLAAVRAARDALSAYLVAPPTRPRRRR